MAAGDPSSEHGVAVVRRFLEDAGDTGSGGRRAHIVRRVARARANGEVPVHLARGDITVILNGRRVGR
jgi:hypothetical protein